MREIFREITGSLVSAALLGVVALVIYWRVKKDFRENVPTLGAVASGAKGILLNGPSALAGALRGESESGYITNEQRMAKAAANLAAKRATLGGR